MRWVIGLLLVAACASMPVKAPQSGWRLDKIPPQVGVLYFFENPGMCTGTIVGERLVLTAAHCAVHGRALFGYDGGREAAIVLDWAVDSKFDEQSEHDLALGFTSAVMSPQPLSIGDEAPKIATFYGFGCHEKVSPRVASVRADNFVYGGGHHTPQLDVCRGDSGGPLLDENGEIVGILSGVNSADSGPHTPMRLTVVWADPRKLKKE